MQCRSAKALSPRSRARPRLPRLVLSSGLWSAVARVVDRARRPPQRNAQRSPAVPALLQGGGTVTARARLLKPDFFDDEDLALVPFGARLLFQALWCQADREGRLEERPLKLAAFAFPYDNEVQRAARESVVEYIDALVQAGCVVRYEVDGQKLLWLPHFKKHQKVHQNEPQSVLPPMVTNGYQRNASHASGAESGSGNKAEADREAEAKAVASRAFVPNLEPPFPDEPGFVGEFVRHWETKHGRHPGGSMVSDAAQLERDFGFDACMQVCQDTNWEKGPAWLRPKLEQRARAPVGVGASTTLAPRPKSLLYDYEET